MGIELVNIDISAIAVGFTLHWVMAKAFSPVDFKGKNWHENKIRIKKSHVEKINEPVNLVNQMVQICFF